MLLVVHLRQKKFVGERVWLISSGEVSSSLPLVDVGEMGGVCFIPFDDIGTDVLCSIVVVVLE
jgi:hypothetical protein